MFCYANAQSPLDKLPSSFKYKKELKNYSFMQGGTFVQGDFEGEDSVNIKMSKRVSIQSVIIGKYEISNKDYREFVNYVFDSLARIEMGYINFLSNGVEKIDWSKKIDFKSMPTMEKLSQLLLPPDERLAGKPEFDTRKFIYKTTKGESIAVYPDTLCWIKDFEYSYNEPFVKRYYSHPAFADFPVVGITQAQALAYCDWKSAMWNAADKANEYTFSLPTVAEWEYASKANSEYITLFNVREETDLAASENLVSNVSENKSTNGYKMNFGAVIDKGFFVKKHDDDGAFYTAPCKSYKPNSFGIYNLSGNVAEWTLHNGSFNVDANAMNAEIRYSVLKEYQKRNQSSPLAGKTDLEIDDYFKTKIVVKGGSWNSTPFYLQPGVNEYMNADEAHCYVGFRVVLRVMSK